ncbi:peptide-methionine (S)-S-oxide reductase MsrA [Microbulbifer sp. S227A]|uniref:peptide-methionine (S)-S-oxide reductase MsrA n=1 Tax=Microbulbifer sp. S227A TaxID=3415131 RepID=UPI003C7DCC9E
MTRLNRFKPILLTILIATAFWIKGQGASAAEPQTLTVAGGCFWCVEADFEKVDGVLDAVSGYAGGTTVNPTYKQVTKGGTGHYEAVRLTFDPDVISRERLLGMFLRSVDPTDAGGQFCDRGDSYRTAIFVSNKAEQSLAQGAIDNAQAELGQPIVTPILSAGRFYPAEAYHQDYYKGTSLVLTRAGPKTQAKAYEFYRKACGRDARVKALWGKAMG